MKKTPKIGITIGDPAGIGPEIAAKLMLDTEFVKQYPFSVISPEFVLEDAFGNILKKPMPEFEINSFDTEVFNIRHGEHSAQCGKLSMLAVEKAVRMIQSGSLDAMVTCPINKHSIAMAGYKFPGHTEFLGHLTNSQNFSMMLASDKMRVIPVTIHIPLKNVASSLTTDKIYLAIENAHNAGKFFGIPSPRIAVTGLNPHAGDEGTLGDEEQTIIIPAIQKARAAAINASGPHPADSLFAHADKYDFFVAMYHDQALIPVKMDGFGRTVNVTLNLPIIRTSVDHGTAFDIAGKGIADPSSLKHAVITAHEMATHNV